MIFGPSGAGGGGISGWVTGTVYVVNDIVYYAKYIYQCITAHTAGASMEVDLASGTKWAKVNLATNAENLMTYGFNFEDNDVGGWTATGCATVTNGLPVSVGTGGAAFSSANGGQAKGANTTNPAIVSSGQINGQYSLSLATSGAGTIGDGYISGIYPLSIKYQAKVLQISFSYKVITGSPVMSGTSANTYACAVYEPVTNSWLGMAGQFNFVQSTGVGTFTGTVQTSSTCTGLQLFVYSPVAPTGASAIYLDDFYLGPQASNSAPAMNDTKTATPSWTNVTVGNSSINTISYRQSGDKMEGEATFALGSTSAFTGEIDLTIPNGLTIDTTKIEVNAIVGVANGYNGAAFISGDVQIISSTKLRAVGAGFSAWNATQPFTWASGNIYRINFRVPIVGWSSNTVQSADTDTRVNTLTGYMSADQTGINTNNSSVKLNYNTAEYNTTGGTLVNGTFTAAITGYYEFSNIIAVSAVNVLANLYQIRLYKNGAWYKTIAEITGVVGTRFGLTGANTGMQMNAGDTAEFYLYGAGNNSASTIGIYGNISNGSMTIKRLSGPAVVQATESVNGRYYSTSSSITNAYSTITYATKDFDSHSAYSGGILTIPVSGKYQFNAKVLQQNTSTAAGNFTGLTINKNNGTLVSETYYTFSGTNPNGADILISDTIQLNAGDTIRIQGLSTGTTPTYGASNSRNYFSWERIGN